MTDIKLGSHSFVERNLLNEKNDCTVRALSEALGIPYLEAYGMMIGYGRKAKKRFNCRPMYSELGTAMPRPAMTVERYVSLIAHSGRWIIEIRGHVFAVIEGEIKDMYPSYNLSRHVVQAWRF